MKKNRRNKHLFLSPVTYLLAIALLTTLLISTGSFYSVDTFRRLQVTHSLWLNSPQVKKDELDDPSFTIVGKDGQKYVTWGLGQSLVMLPSDMLAHKLTDRLPINQKLLEKIQAGLVTYLTFPLINILSVIVGFRFLQHLGFNNRQSILGTLGLLFGTTFLVYAQYHQENSLLFLMILSGYLLNLVWIQSNSTLCLFFGACALGFNLLVRLTSLFDLFAVSVFTASSSILQAKARNWDLRLLKKRFSQYLLICGTTYFFFLVIDRLYHWRRFAVLTGTYQHIWGEQMKIINPNLPDSFPFSTPFLEGFWGFLFSAERAIFLFNPLLIITLILSIRYWNKLPNLIKILEFSFIFLLLANLIIYAKWFLWGGAGSWGPRYATIPSQLLSLLAIPLLLKLYPFIKGDLEKLFYKAIVFLSILIQFSSIILDFNLELSQASSWSRSTFVIGQRFINLLAIWTGNFEAWGLRPANNTSEEVRKFITPVFLPWATLGELPIYVSYILQLIWFIGLIMLIYFSYSLLRNTFRGMYDVAERGHDKHIV